MNMTRLNAGLISGAVGAVVAIGLSFLRIPVVGLLIPILVGIGAGVLVANNPKYAGKSGHAGALTGLLAGALLFVAAIIGSIISLNSPETQSTLNQALQTPEAAATATATAGGTSSSKVDFKTIAEGSLVFISCIGGLLSLGVATGIGAAAGAIAGRSNAAPPVNPYGQFGAVPPYGVPQQPGYPPQPQTGYPPQQPSASPYGSQQPPAYNPPPADVPPGYPPPNDGTH
jgi:hypothetical protein